MSREAAAAHASRIRHLFADGDACVRAGATVDALVHYSHALALLRQPLPASAPVFASDEQLRTRRRQVSALLDRIEPLRRSAQRAHALVTAHTEQLDQLAGRLAADGQHALAADAYARIEMLWGALLRHPTASEQRWAEWCAADSSADRLASALAAGPAAADACPAPGDVWKAEELRGAHERMAFARRAAAFAYAASAALSESGAPRSDVRAAALPLPDVLPWEDDAVGAAQRQRAEQSQVELQAGLACTPVPAVPPSAAAPVVQPTSPRRVAAQVSAAVPPDAEAAAAGSTAAPSASPRGGAAALPSPRGAATAATPQHTVSADDEETDRRLEAALQVSAQVEQETKHEADEAVQRAREITDQMSRAIALALKRGKARRAAHAAERDAQRDARARQRAERALQRDQERLESLKAHNRRELHAAPDAQSDEGGVVGERDAAGDGHALDGAALALLDRVLRGGDA